MLNARLFYDTLTVGVMVTAVFAYWAFFRRLRDALWLLPGIVMWFSHRSFHHYFLYWIPVALFWFVLGWDGTASLDNERRRPSPILQGGGPPRTQIAGGIALGSILLLTLATAIATVTSSSEPIEVKVITVSARAVPGVIDAMTVQLTNRLEAPIEPEFAIIRSGQPTTWEIEQGPRTLAAGATAIYVIVAPPGSASLPVRNSYAGAAGAGREPVLLRVTARGTDASASVWVPGF